METTQVSPQMNGLTDIHTIGYYLSIKENAAPEQATTWMKVKDVMLSERSHSREHV